MIRLSLIIAAFLGFFTSSTVASYAFIKNPLSRINRSWGALSFFVGLMSIGWGMLIYSNNIPQASFWLKICFLGGFFIPSTFLGFVYAFLLKDDRTLVKYSYLISAIFFILFICGYSVDLAYNTDLGFYWWKARALYHLYIVQIILTVVYGLILLCKKLLISHGTAKNQIMYVFIASVLGLSSGFTAFLPAYNIPIFPIGLYPFFIYPLVVAYAITKHHLMDISVVISRTIAELSSVALLGSIYVGLVMLYRNNISVDIGIPFIAWTILYGILVGQTQQRFRFFIQTSSDKVFLKGKYDYYKELSEISSRISRSLLIENIIQTLHKAFYEVIEVSNPRIYLIGDLCNSELKGYLDIKEPTLQDKELILPCRLEARLIAMIILGPKLSEDPYTDEDLRLLKNIANQTAVALDHHRMYEEMLKAQKQLLLADKLASLGNVAANIANEIKPSLVKLKTMTEISEFNKGTIKNNKETIVDKIDHVNGLIENILGPIRKGKS